MTVFPFRVDLLELNVSRDWNPTILFLGFMWSHNFTGGQLQIDAQSSEGNSFFTVCVDPVFHSKYVQFHEIFSLQYGTIWENFGLFHVTITKSKG